jgi:deazaflavin-dependent oxidoreductase (nitroreductase family)
MLDPQLAGEDFCYVTTTGRVTGNPHTIEIWFAAHDDSIYILAGGGHASDWVKNVKRRPSVPVRIGSATFKGHGRIVDAPDEDARARRLLLEKYGPRYSGDLDDWGRTALPIAIDLHKEPG